MVEVVVCDEYGVKLIQRDLSLCQLGCDTAPGVEQQSQTRDLDKGRRPLSCRIRSRPAGAKKGDTQGGGV